MPKAAFFLLLLVASMLFSNSYGSISDESFHNANQKSEIIFDSGIVDIDSEFFSSNDFKRYLIFGTNNNDSFIESHSKKIVKSNNGFFSIAVLPENSIPSLLARGYSIIEDYPLDFHSETDASRIGLITGSTQANSVFNVNGSGTRIAIIDTGVDFSNPDIQHSLARNEIKHPLMLDPDGQGLVLTNATFFAFIDNNGIIRNYSKDLPKGFTSGVYVNKEGVFLSLSNGGKGTDIPIYNSFFPQAGSSITFNGTLANDMKIGQNNRNYIKSQSGVYHLGVIYQGALSGPLTRIQVVPVLIVDSHKPGVYDTIIPDMSTSWKDYTRFDLKRGEKPNYDFDFTDEKPIVLGSGNEFLVYDSNGDGRSDYTAGTVGAQVLDIHSVIQNKTAIIDDTINAVNGTLLSGMDPAGNYFGVMNDFQGHGTASAASIVSRGEQQYDIYNNTKKSSITGVAPGAKIVPIKALWFGDTVYAWLWAAGFDNKETTWEFTGKPRVDIISNSWGVSTFPNYQSAPGKDILSVIVSVLSTPQSLHQNYPGVVIVSSAGNSGHGYGTISLPNASPFGITVGATTNNVFVGYGPFKGEPRFGNSTEHYNDLADFSSRGPGIIGDPKPDLMSIGAHGFTPKTVLTLKKELKEENFSLFGGTSMAAPLVSGSAALLIEELNKKSQTYNPFDVKNILMSTAIDLKNDPFVQGAGLVNAYDALRYVNNEEIFLVTNDASYSNIRKSLLSALSTFNHTSVGMGKFELPARPLPMGSWYAGELEPNQRSEAIFTVTNPSDAEIDVNIESQKLVMMRQNQMNGTTTVQQQDPILNKTGVYAPNYIKLSDVKTHTKLSDFFDERKPIYNQTDLMVLNLNFPFTTFMNKTTDTYADDLKISSLYLYDWLDNNNDTKIASDELSLVNRAGSWGTVQELRISDPQKKFEGEPIVGVYPVPKRYSFWLGETKNNATSMDYTLSASYYKKQNWPMVWTDVNKITIPPNSEAKVKATLVPSSDLQTGVYQGFLNFKSDKHTTNVPISFVIKKTIDSVDSTVVIPGKESSDVLHNPGYIKGAFDMTNRYMAGDWQQFYFDIKDEKINTAAIEMSWISNNTNLSVFAMDPKGRIIHTNMPSGVFGELLGWASLDWLGGSPFSQGGGFYPVKNKDDTSTVLYVPINQTGVYSILAHATLFGGHSTTEPVSVAAKFLNISADQFPSQKDLVQDSMESIPQINNTNNTNQQFTNESETVTIVTPIPEKPESTVSDGMIVGLGIGIGIGVVIGVVSLLLIRQKSSN